MNNEHRWIGLITARGGSKGLPGKNTMPLAGHPLIAHTIMAGRDAGLEIIISTDSEQIARVGADYDAAPPFMRPAHLATDSASSKDVITHAIDALSLTSDDVICLLQPTSPLRTTQDILDARAIFEAHGDPVISVTPNTKPPSWLFELGGDERLSPFFGALPASQRQRERSLWLPNGAIYIARVSDWVERASVAVGARAYIMPAERSVDIDTPLDFTIARALFEERAQGNGS